MSLIDVWSGRGRPDEPDALEQMRREAKDLLDRNWTWPRRIDVTAGDGVAAAEPGAMNLSPYRPTDRIALGVDEDSKSDRDGFRKAASDYFQDLYHPAPITGDRLRQIAPRAGAWADEYAPYLENAMTLGGILTPSQRAAFLAQVAIETGDLRPRRESLNYSDAQRAANIFHSTFHGDPEQARPYLGNSEKMANHVYQGLNGDGPEASGDGYAYRGGGLLQVTGRGNYRAVGLEDHPEAIERPDVAAQASVGYWRSRGLNAQTYEPIASQEGFDAVTRKINKGLLQRRERWQAYQRGLNALSKPAARRP